MARQSSSRVNFDVNIKGIDDAKQLSQIMPKLIDQFNQLATSVSDVEERSEGIKNVKENIIMMDVNVLKGNINSLQDLGRAYGSLVNQINALEKKGAPVASLRKKAIEQHQRLRDKIIQQSNSTEELSASERELAQSAKMAGMSTQQLKNQLQQSGMSLDQFNNKIQQTGQYTRNASYVWLNFGYMVQDSPYGVRGMANNVSQLLTAYQLLGQRVNELNQAGKGQITVWGALRKTFMGPTGLMLLLGSLLPAALVVLDRKWDDWFGNIEDSDEMLEQLMSTLNEFISLQAEIKNSFGEDPLGISKMIAEYSEMGIVAEDLREIADAMKTLDKARKASLVSYQTGPMVSGMQALSTEEGLRRTKESAENLKAIREEFGDLEKIDLKKLNEQIEELEHNLSLSQTLLQRSPLLSLQANVSSMVETYISNVELMRDDRVSEKMRESAELSARAYLEHLEKTFDELIASGEYDSAKVIKEGLDSLRGLFEEDEEEEEKKTAEDEIEPIEAQYEFRKQMLYDLNELTLDQAKRRVNTAVETSERIKAIQAREKLQLDQLKYEEFENDYQRELERRKIKRESADEITEIEKNAILERLKFEIYQAEVEMNEPQAYESRLESINTFYNRKENLIRESAETEEQIRRELFKNEVERDKALLNEKERHEESKRQLAQMTAGILISSFQTVGNLIGASAKEQFRVRKIASAAQAIINGYLGASKTVGELGIFGIPASKLSIAFGYAQAAAIMSQSYGSARSTGAGSATGGYSGLTSYRGFDFMQGQSAGVSYEGSRSINSESSTSGTNNTTKVKAQFTDGFGKLVSEGMLELQRTNKDDLGLWGGN